MEGLVNKYLSIKHAKLAGVLMGWMLFTASCSQPELDKEIKADITVKARGTLNFAGVDYQVQDGIVTLTGQCPSEYTRLQVESTVKNIAIIKGIVDNIKVAPVTITTDQPLKEQVDSVLMNFANVTADVANDTVTLKGQIRKKDAGQMIKQVSQLNPLNIRNEVKVN